MEVPGKFIQCDGANRQIPPEFFAERKMKRYGGSPNSVPIHVCPLYYCNRASNVSSEAGVFWARNSASCLPSGILYIVLLPASLMPVRK